MPQSSLRRTADDEISRAVRQARALIRAAAPPFRTVGMQMESAINIPDYTSTVLSILNLSGTASPATLAAIAAETQRQEAQELLWGLKLGAGVSLVTSGRRQSIREVTVDTNRIVRITKEDNSSVNYLLEAHYFFTPDHPFLGMDKFTTGSWGIGPFVAVQTGADRALSGIGFGLMLGFKQPVTNPLTATNLSWNIGVGALYDPAVKVLGTGIYANQPLPAGEAVVRTTEVGGWGLMVMTSFNF
jgi:hypothetical protein